MIVVILIVAIIAGIFLAGLMAPIIMAANRKKIAEMKALLEDFESIAPGWRGGKRTAYRMDLIAIKRKIFPSDKASVEEARDLLAAFERIGD